jgi:UDP-N-acetylmuramoyl-tripeptide--D-alanyl-D-alanine ligase
MLIKNLLYILQSDDYCAGRFLKYSYSHFKWWRLEQRQKLIWTKKSFLIYCVSSFIFLMIFAIAGFFIKLWVVLFMFIVLLLLPFIIILSLQILKPLDYYLKKQITGKAKRIINDSKIIVIGITGSYGKTSTKEILAKILEEKFSVIKTPNNINTDIGISEFIIKSKSTLASSQIFIVEMGAYHRGDIEKICDIVKPGYSILTGINESHLEKFGNLENTIAAKFELPQNTTIMSIINTDDANIRNNYSKFKLDNIFINDSGNVSGARIKENFSGIYFFRDKYEYTTKLLALHNISLISMSIILAGLLGMETPKIQEGIKKITPFKHRLEPIYNSQTDIWVIDDSYNGNFNGIESGLEVLSRATGRKIVLTPGLVELGVMSQNIHEKIGGLYSQKADMVLLIKNNVTRYIIDGMKKNNFTNFKIYSNTSEAHADLVNILKSGDTIIFQNDWPDNYF